MSTGVFFIILIAALLHAGWNALVKNGTDKALGVNAVVLGQGIFGAVTLFFVPAPNMASWGYILAGVALHTGYQLFLTAAYRIGDLTQVYPIARGTAPLLVALFSVMFLSVVLSVHELLAIALIGLGIMSLSLTRHAQGQSNGLAAVLALTTGCFIASYSLVDGLGARIAGSPLGFYGWLSILNAILMLSITRLHQPVLLPKIWRAWKVAIFGGGASFTAFALIIYAFTIAPIALVTALRETSIIFALLIGVFFLKERLNLIKLISTMITISGVILLRLGKG
jgi:drug/metabolite transporter (DMT)-like permease